MKYTEGLDKIEKMILDRAPVAGLRAYIQTLYQFAEAEDQRTTATIKQNEELVAQNQNVIAQKNAIETKQAELDANRHKVGVTLKNGKTVYYDANYYTLLPNKNAPVTIEFQMMNKERHTYRPVGHAQWSDVSEVHEPSA